MAAVSKAPVVKAEIQTEIEDTNGMVLVQAVASAERQLDGRAIAGYFVRRRVHGERFRISRPEQFSATWMRFVDEPPEDWIKVFKTLKTKDINGKERLRFPDFDVMDLRAEEPIDPNKPTRPFSMGELQRQGKQNHTMNYSNGAVQESP